MTVTQETSILVELSRLETLAKRFESGETDVPPQITALTLSSVIQAFMTKDAHLANLINGLGSAKKDRDAIIEECAKVCDQLGDWAGELYVKDIHKALLATSQYKIMQDACDECAERIRYMKEEPPRCNHWPGQDRCGVCGMGSELPSQHHSGEV
jgi:hypothetical protein